MTKQNLEGLTVAQIKAQYPNGAYKASMKKADVIKAALESAPKAKSTAGSRANTER